MAELTGKQKRFLKALAHDLDPVVQIGTAGITPGVMTQVDQALEQHELIKVKLGRETPVTKEDASKLLTSGVHCHCVQQIGHVLVLFRRRKQKPDIELPR